MDALIHVFTHSLDPNPNARKAAELELKKVETQDGMLFSVFQVVASPQVELPVRQAASIYAKNRVRRHWDETPVRGAPTQTVIPKGDRESIKSIILPALVEAPAQTRVHIASALGTITRCDFPDSWPNLMDQVGELLRSQNPQQVYGGLRALLEVVRAFQWSSGAKMMEKLAPATLPHILQTGTSLLNSEKSSTAEVGEILYLIVKIYKTSMHIELTSHQQSHESIVPWGTFLLNVVQKQIEPSQLPSDDDAKEQASWWKAKKWAFHSLNKLFSRYGNPSQIPSDMKQYKPFAEHFVQTFAPEILKVYLKLVDLNTRASLWMSKKAFYFICMFLTECIKPKSTWALLKPHALPLIRGFLFPRMCFSDESDEQWELDAVDFVRANMDPFEEIGTVSGSAATFVQTVASKRTKAVFMPLLEFITSVLNDSQRSPREKDGALHLCRAMDVTMVNHENVSDMLDGFFGQHVIPQLASPHRFLRFRACDLINSFDRNSMNWSNGSTLETAFQGVMNCIGDDELPVRVVAAEAIGTLIDHDEVHAAMAPNAATLMQELLKLSDETDLDVLSATQAKVVATFSEELLPFSVQLTEQTAASYMRLLNETLEAADQDADGTMDINTDNHEDEKTFVAMGCLNTIFQIIAAAESKPEILERLEAIILPIVAFTLEKDCVELFDDCFELTDTLTYYQKKISPGMWHIFTLIYKSFKSAGIDYLSEMLSTIDNCISYGVDVVRQSAEYKTMLVDIFLTAMTSDQLGLTDKVAACKLADVILLLLRGAVDEAVPQILTTVLAHTVDEDPMSADVRKWSIIVVLDALVYNASLTLQVLEGASATPALFGAITSLLPKMTRVHEKKVASSAIIELLSLEPATLPAALQANLSAFLVALATQLDGLPEAIEKRNKMIEAFENGDDDAEEDEEDTSFASSAGVSIDQSAYEDVDDDKDVVDEDNEYLEMFARERAKLRASANGEEFEDDDDEEDEFEDDEEDELSYESPMDSVPVFEQFRQLLSNFQTHRPDVWAKMTSSLTQDQMALIQRAAEGQDQVIKTI